MKTLTLKLKRDVLIVDVPELTDYEVFKHGIYFNFENGDRDFVEGNFTFLCQGTPTEEQAAELVDKVTTTLWKNYQNVPYYFEFLKNSAVESFLSAVSAENWNWIVNPRGETKPVCFEEDELCAQLWHQVESRTLKNPLIFVKL